MSLAGLGSYSLGPKPRWCCCDVILSSDLLSKHTAFGVSPLKTDLTLLISLANSTLVFGSTECEKAAVRPTVIKLMIDIATSLCLDRSNTSCTAHHERNPIVPYMVKTVSSKVQVNPKLSISGKDQHCGQYEMT